MPKTNGKSQLKPSIEALESVTQSFAAQFLGLSRTALQKWETDHDAPRLENGRYNLPELVRWRLEFLSREADAIALTGSNSPALERWRRARADAAEHEVKRLHGEFAPRADVAAALNAIADAIRETVEAAERKLGREAFEYLDEKLGADALKRITAPWASPSKQNGETQK